MFLTNNQDISVSCFIKYLEHFHFREVDFQALIGNIGGYIGLCLGYSLLQVPDFLLVLVSQIKNYILHKQNKKMKVDEDTVVTE